MQKKEKNNNFYMAFCDDRFKINRIAVTFIDRLERRKKYFECPVSNGFNKREQQVQGYERNK